MTQSPRLYLSNTIHRALYQGGPTEEHVTIHIDEDTNVVITIDEAMSLFDAMSINPRIQQKLDERANAVFATQPTYDQGDPT